MGLLDRDYMRETPRTHVGETQRPDLAWVHGPPRRGVHPLTVALVVLVVVVALLLLGAVLSGALVITTTHG